MCLDEVAQYRQASIMPAHQYSTETVVTPPDTTNITGHYLHNSQPHFQQMVLQYDGTSLCDSSLQN